MRNTEAVLSSIEAVVHAGNAVVSADDSIVMALMRRALKSGDSVTFYISPEQGSAVMRWYWTPARIREAGLEQVSKEERARIESELGIKDMGPAFSNRIQCSCGAVYGAFEFMQQGLRVHGREWVGAIFELKGAAVLRINPAQDAFCAQCHQLLIEYHNYEMRMPNGTLSYGCCRSEGSGGTILV